MNTSELTPVEVDTALAELYAKIAKARDTYDRIQAAFAREMSGIEGEWRYNPYTPEDSTEAWNTLKALIEESLVYEAEYEKRPWQRYWHVQNVNGHIHRFTSCSTCFHDTVFAWRTDLSGLTDVEVVEREAYNACTVCMPIAPAEQKAAREKRTKEQREAKAAERQAKKDAKYAKAAERAVKHFDKVEKAIEQMGGKESFFKDYSLHGHDGRKSVYEFTSDLPAQVGDTLYFLKQTQEEGRSHHDLNEAMTAEAKKRGLLV